MPAQLWDLLQVRELVHTLVPCPSLPAPRPITLGPEHLRKDYYRP